MCHELEGLDWEWQPLAWHSRLSRPADWLGNLPCVSDSSEPDSSPAGAGLDALRLPLMESEIRKFRWLGRRAAQCVESTCRRLEPGMTESGIAALAARELQRHAIEPVHVAAAADARAESFVEPQVSESHKLERLAWVRATVRRWGLHATLTRLAHIGPIPRELAAKAATAARLLAGCWARTEPGRRAGDHFQDLISDAVEAGFPRAWEEAGPGGGIGYREQEWVALPGSDRRLDKDKAYAWRAGVGGIRFEETIVLAGETLDPVAVTGEWPVTEVRALDRVYRIPTILAL
jgi:Xaa-Pro aminopeptidase